MALSVADMNVADTFRQKRRQAMQTFGSVRTKPVREQSQPSADFPGEQPVTRPFELVNAWRQAEKARRVQFIGNLLSHDPDMRAGQIIRELQVSAGVSERTAWRDWRTYREQNGNGRK